MPNIFADIAEPILSASSKHFEQLKTQLENSFSIKSLDDDEDVTAKIASRLKRSSNSNAAKSFAQNNNEKQLNTDLNNMKIETAEKILKELKDKLNSSIDLAIENFRSKMNASRIIFSTELTTKLDN